MQALPVAVPPQIPADSVLAQEMTLLMREYSERLLQIRVLSWQDAESFQTHDWTPHLGKFQEACSKQAVQCILVLQSQLGALRDLVEQSGDAPRTTRIGAALSAMSDLCARAPWTGKTDAQIFGLCGGQAGIASGAAVAWLQLGYDELFLAYYAMHEQNRLRTIAWLAEQPPSDRTAQEQRQRLESHVSHIVSAEYFEKTDQLYVARGAWLVTLNSLLQKKSFAQMLIPSLNLARLSYLLGDVEQGNSWHYIAERIGTEYPDYQSSRGCVYELERTRTERARASATNTSADAIAAVKALIARDCDYAGVAVEHALADLRAARQAQAAAILELAIGACKQTGQCADSRMHHLKNLLVIARGDEVELLQQSGRWLADGKRGQFNAVERQTAWALADVLKTHAQGQSAAQQLYTILDEQIYGVGFAKTGMSQSDLKNLARYDGLRRQRVKGAVQQGEVLWFDRTESLRAQSLLRRLRFKRWQTEFAGVRDDAANASLQTALAATATFRASLADNTWNSTPLFRALRDELTRMAPEIEADAHVQYLRELASRRAEARGASIRRKWIGAIDDLFWHELDKDSRSGTFSSLGADEAYLSWLNVPGGYVGTLAVPDPQRTGTWGSHRLVARFLAVPPPMASTLDLYRKLLLSGSAAHQAAPVQIESRGLMLEGVPVWRQPDGSFVASGRKIPGAVRAKSLAEISDAISESLLAPFQENFKSVRRLVISPDGELAYLPFETLSIAGTPILDSLDIAYVQSLAVHEELTARARAPKSRGHALLTMADPDYTLATAPPSAAPAIAGELAAVKWKPLPGTRIESDTMVRLFPEGRQRLGPQASRKQLDDMQRRGELKNYRILHFATHGYVDDKRSALVLSMVNGVDQGFLQDTDVLDLQLDSDLVLLSACDTGIGRNVSGEGVMGLPYAFLLAGNSNTLMSLWPVEDKGTASFMAAFMEKVRARTDFLVALNQTKREFARGDHGAAFSDPRVWAAFVQYGVGISLRK